MKKYVLVQITDNRVEQHNVYNTRDEAVKAMGESFISNIKLDLEEDDDRYRIVKCAVDDGDECWDDYSDEFSYSPNYGYAWSEICAEREENTYWQILEIEE